MSGAQGRPKMVKPGGVDIDGNYVTEGGRRTYTPASVGTVLGGTPNQMKSPKKMAKKSTMKLKKKSANKLNPGFDKLPKDVQAKILKKSPKKLKPITKGKQSRAKNIKPEAKPNKRNYNF